MAKKEKKSGKKKLLIALSLILVVAIATSTVVFVKYKDMITPPAEVPQDTNVYDFDEDETVPETLASDPIFDTIYEETAASYKDAVKKWATNGGEVMYSNHVINILCCGVDTRNPNAIAGLTDTILIMSINTELKTVTLTSVMRDSFCYIQNPDGEGGTFNKINAAFPFYGVDGLIPAIENNFKIRIDGYALINFSLFKAAIDKLGGVTVPVQQYEANYMNATYENCSIEAGEAVTYGLYNAQDRGTLFIGPGEKVYSGMVVGQSAKTEDIEINVCKKKQLTNTRSSSADEALRLTPKKVLSLEQALEFIDTDELLEVTPTSLRIRKKILDPTMRKRSKR